MKYSQWIGVVASLLLIAACFLPWAYYPDLQKNFTGFFSEKNMYGRPGKVLVFLGVVAMILFLVPRIWAKRTNMLLGAVILAFSIKSFILFTACYKGICPDRREGVFLILIAPVIMILCAILPDIKLREKTS
ncbi:MAG TPA: hypothetical protein VK563_24165 [Puia sp.]|nr:hypothetical protein [Puia sp.]